MDAKKVVALVLIVAGVTGLAYGGFTYTQETHETHIGPINLSIKDQKTVNIPVWAGVGLLVVRRLRGFRFGHGGARASVDPFRQSPALWLTAC